MDKLNLESVGMLYGNIQILQNKHHPATKEESEEKSQVFDKHVRMVTGTLRARMEKMSQPHLKEAEILLARHGLYDICFQEIINHAAEVYPEMSTILRSLRLAHSEIMQSLPAVLRQDSEELFGEVDRLKCELSKTKAQEASVLDAAESLEKEADRQRAEIGELTNKLKILEMENDLLRQKKSPSKNGSAQVYLSPSKPKKSSASKKGVGLNVTKPPMVRDSSCASSVTEVGGRVSRSRRSSVVSSIPREDQSAHCLSQRSNPSVSFLAFPSPPYSTHHQDLGPAPRTQKSSRAGSVLATGGMNTSIRGSPAASFIGPSSHHQKLFQQGLGELERPSTDDGKSTSGQGEGLGSRTLTFRQLKEMIEQIYASKVKCDEHHRKTRLSRETMEQHMFTYLNQKYGLRNLIIEYAAAIMKGIEKYSRTDNDVAVFGRIISHEIDEEFRFVQKQLKQSIRDLLKVHLKGKFPLKADGAINSLLNQKLNGQLQSTEWSDIVKYMYNDEDAAMLISMIKSAGQNPTDKDAAEKGTAIQFTEFLNILLNFQLEGQTKFLEKFKDFFRMLDTDGNGIITRIQFQELCAKVCPDKVKSAEADEMAKKLDPFSNDQITYSDCVACLSSDILDMMLEDMSKSAITGSTTRSVRKGV